MCMGPGPTFFSTFCDSLLLYVGSLINSWCWLNPSWCLVLTLSCPVLLFALSVWMEQCASTASLLASVREQERQFEMLSRALEEERRSCAGTLPRPLPNMQVTLYQPRALSAHRHACFHQKPLDSPFIRGQFLHCHAYGHPILSVWAG